MDLETHHTLNSKGELTKGQREEGTEKKQGHLYLDILLRYNEGNFL